MTMSRRRLSPSSPHLAPRIPTRLRGVARTSSRSFGRTPLSSGPRSSPTSSLLTLPAATPSSIRRPSLTTTPSRTSSHPSLRTVDPSPTATLPLITPRWQQVPRPHPPRTPTRTQRSSTPQGRHSCPHSPKSHERQPRFPPRFFHIRPSPLISRNPFGPSSMPTPLSSPAGRQPLEQASSNRRECTSLDGPGSSRRKESERNGRRSRASRACGRRGLVGSSECGRS